MVVAAFNQNKAFSVIVKLHKGSFQALVDMSAPGHVSAVTISLRRHVRMSACSTWPHCLPASVLGPEPDLELSQDTRTQSGDCCTGGKYFRYLHFCCK